MNNIAIVTIFTYLIFCILFFIIKYLVIDNDTNYPNTSWIKSFCAFSFFIYFIQNTYYSTINSSDTTKCSISFTTIILSSLIPLIFILFPIIFLVVILEWDYIFTNTIGYSITQKLFDDKINTYIHSKTYDEIKDFKQINMLLNKERIGPITDHDHKKLLNEFKKKKNIGYFMWFMMAGIVSSLASANTILLQDCIIE